VSDSSLRYGTRVLLCVSGGIAAYKSAILVRRLRERGALVRCALSQAAESFVTPLTLEVLSGHPVYRQEYLEANGSGEELHMTAVQWADVVCVAPCTANMLGRFALGLADDFISTCILAFEGPVLVAPAMHSAMWQKPSVQDNVRSLVGRGVEILGPAEGALASGETGIGRMVEPDEIVDAIAQRVASGPLAGKTVLIDAGPTREPLDPVRYLSNHSSGRMGFALAAEAARRGARVLLVAGPVALETPPGVERFDVVTAIEMCDEVYRLAPSADLVILCAAVADFRPEAMSEHKIKKSESGASRDEMVVRFVPNPDILAGLSEVAPEAVRVGFAAETRDLEKHAQEKLERKRAHFLVANDVSRSDIGFGADHNEVVVFRDDGSVERIEKQSKNDLARRLFDLFEQAL
jgi:phosphopantothenoylcysteine decarboxylase/phosphopantothenate--cysteine ligase